MGFRLGLRLRPFLPSLSAGLIAGILNLAIGSSFSVLVFSGPLAGDLARGIGLFLFSYVTIGTIVALTSSIPGTVAGPQDSSTAILALIAAAISKDMATASPQDRYANVVAAIALTSLVTGACFFLLGRFKLGNFIRFVPYPVMGGFLAGTGWLLVVGALNAMTGIQVGFSDLPRLGEPNILLHWLPGVIFAVALLAILRRVDHFLVMPTFLLLSIGLVFLALFLTHTSISQAFEQGWLLGNMREGALWQPVLPSDLARIDWRVIIGQADKMATIAIISLVAFLLNVSGIELSLRRETDLNHELQSVGVANVVGGAGSAPLSYHYLLHTLLLHELGARGRLAPLVAVGLVAVAMVFGASLLAYFPTPILGGLLLFLGLALLVEWAFDACRKLPRTDYAIVLLILILIAGVGILEGVVGGIIVAMILFVVNYSQINIVKHALSGATFHSQVDRPPAHRQLLREKGSALYILQLQGYLFFGTAQNLLRHIRQRLQDANQPPVQFLVLDFQRVNGLDSSAVSSFVRLRRLADNQQVQLVLTHLSPRLRDQLAKGGIDNQLSSVHLFDELDRGLEWCENQILQQEHVALNHTVEPLQTQLEQVLSAGANVAHLLTHLQRLQVAAGQYLIRQGEKSDSLYFIESGSMEVQLELREGRTTRLRTMKPGTVIGEVGFYLGGLRTASVVATEPSTVYWLSAQVVRQLEGDEPELAAALHKWIARLLAERLAENVIMLEALAD